MRTSMTQSERREKFAETHQVATALISAQRVARDQKTAKLRAMRLAAEADKAANRARPSPPAKK
jgi:hypothetical protein